MRYKSPSIIKYLESKTVDIFTAQFADYHFDEANFSALREYKKQLENEITWNASLLYHFDPRTNQCELEIQMIVHFQNITNQLPNAFTNLKTITKSHIPAVNALVRIVVQ